MQEQATSALAAGTAVNGYVVERVLAADRFSLRYQARSGVRPVVLQELLPQEQVTRQGSAVTARDPADAAAFADWQAQFLAQCQSLAGLSHPALPKLRDSFTANGTAYAVFEPTPGETLDAVLQREGTLDEPRLRRGLASLLDGLDAAHAAGLMHRDICPAHLRVAPDGGWVLTDFSVIRAPIRLRHATLAGTAQAPYAAPEDSDAAGRIGVWSDLYSLGAVAYRVVTGNAPQSAQARLAGVALVPAQRAARIRASQALLEAIDGAMVLAPENRPRTVPAWRNALRAESQEEAATPLLRAPERRAGAPVAAIAIAGLALAGVAGAWWFTRATPAAPPAGPAGAIPEAAPEAARSASAEPAAASPSSGSGSSLDRIAESQMARDRKAQEARDEKAREDKQRQEEALAKEKREAAAKLAAASTSAGASPPPTRPAEPPKASTGGDSAPRPAAAAAPPSSSTSADDQALKQELERLRAELRTKQQTGEVPKPAGTDSGPAYRQSVNGVVGSRLRYPADSRANQEEGTTVVRVKLARSGQVASTSVVQSSGYPQLDAEAQRVFTRIGRFNPVPADMSPGAAEVDITLPIRFRLADN